MKEMYELLARLYAVQILADDLHYRSEGLAFYALHLLADRVKDGIADDIDSLRETFFMGEMKVNPPQTSESMKEAAEIAKAISNDTNGADTNHTLVFRLRDAVNSVIHIIETIKRGAGNGEGAIVIYSGTAAVLDGISQKMMVAYALLDRTSL